LIRFDGAAAGIFDVFLYLSGRIGDIGVSIARGTSIFVTNPVR
jgi:hypothetical protein